MTQNILALVPAQPVTNEVVEFLEGALEKARAGEYSSVALATVGRDGSMGNGWSTLHSFALMTGSCARLLHKVNLEADNA